MNQHQAAIRILIAGFGGQGVLFLGKLIALAASENSSQVTWLPSYGPEMRGGTANCGVIISNCPIGSPIVSQPDLLIAMNLPSYQAFEPKVARGGVILLDSSLVQAHEARADVSYDALPAAKMAAEAGLDGLANMVLLGKALACLPLEDRVILSALRKAVPAHKEHLLQANLNALELGRAYRAERMNKENSLRDAESRARRAV